MTQESHNYWVDPLKSDLDGQHGRALIQITTSARYGIVAILDRSDTIR